MEKTIINPEINEQVIDLELDIVNNWDISTKNMLSSRGSNNEYALLEELLKSYLQSLPENVLEFEKPMLSEKMLTHLEYFNCYYTEIKDTFLEKPDYYEIMEDVLVYYCKLQLDIIKHSIHKKGYSKNELFYRVIRNNLCTVLKTFLGNKELHVIHTLLKLNYDCKITNCRDFINEIYRHCLLYTPPESNNDEEFCRNYLLFQKWKDNIAVTAKSSSQQLNTHEIMNGMCLAKFGKQNEENFMANNKLMRTILQHPTSISSMVRLVMNFQVTMFQKYLSFVKEHKEDLHVDLPIGNINLEDETGGSTISETVVVSDVDSEVEISYKVINPVPRRKERKKTRRRAKSPSPCTSFQNLVLDCDVHPVDDSDTESNQIRIPSKTTLINKCKSVSTNPFTETIKVNNKSIFEHSVINIAEDKEKSYKEVEIQTETPPFSYLGNYSYGIVTPPSDHRIYETGFDIDSNHNSSTQTDSVKSVQANCIDNISKDIVENNNLPELPQSVDNNVAIDIFPQAVISENDTEPSGAHVPEKSERLSLNGQNNDHISKNNLILKESCDSGLKENVDSSQENLLDILDVGRKEINANVVENSTIQSLNDYRKQLQEDSSIEYSSISDDASDIDDCNKQNANLGLIDSAEQLNNGQVINKDLIICAGFQEDKIKDVVMDVDKLEIIEEHIDSCLKPIVNKEETSENNVNNTDISDNAAQSREILNNSRYNSNSEIDIPYLESIIPLKVCNENIENLQNDAECKTINVGPVKCMSVREELINVPNYIGDGTIIKTRKRKHKHKLIKPRHHKQITPLQIRKSSNNSKHKAEYVIIKDNKLKQTVKINNENALINDNIKSARNSHTIMEKEETANILVSSPISEIFPQSNCVIEEIISEKKDHPSDKIDDSSVTHKEHMIDLDQKINSKYINQLEQHTEQPTLHSQATINILETRSKIIEFENNMDVIDPKEANLLSVIASESIEPNIPDNKQLCHQIELGNEATLSQYATYCKPVTNNITISQKIAPIEIKGNAIVMEEEQVLKRPEIIAENINTYCKAVANNITISQKLAPIEIKGNAIVMEEEQILKRPEIIAENINTCCKPVANNITISQKLAPIEIKGNAIVMEEEQILKRPEIIAENINTCCKPVANNITISQKLAPIEIKGNPFVIEEQILKQPENINTRTNIVAPNTPPIQITQIETGLEHPIIDSIPIATESMGILTEKIPTINSIENYRSKMDSKKYETNNFIYNEPINIRSNSSPAERIEVLQDCRILNKNMFQETVDHQKNIKRTHGKNKECELVNDVPIRKELRNRRRSVNFPTENKKKIVSTDVLKNKSENTFTALDICDEETNIYQMPVKALAENTKESPIKISTSENILAAPPNISNSEPSKIMASVLMNAYIPKTNSCVESYTDKFANSKIMYTSSESVNSRSSLKDFRVFEANYSKLIASNEHFIDTFEDSFSEPLTNMNKMPPIREDINNSIHGENNKMKPSIKMPPTLENPKASTSTNHFSPESSRSSSPSPQFEPISDFATDFKQTIDQPTLSAQLNKNIVPKSILKKTVRNVTVIPVQTSTKLSLNINEAYEKLKRKFDTNIKPVPKRQIGFNQKELEMVENGRKCKRRLNESLRFYRIDRDDPKLKELKSVVTIPKYSERELINKYLDNLPRKVTSLHITTRSCILTRTERQAPSRVPDPAEYSNETPQTGTNVCIDRRQVNRRRNNIVADKIPHIPVKRRKGGRPKRQDLFDSVSQLPSYRKCT